MSKKDNFERLMQLKTVKDMADFIFDLIMQVHKLEIEIKELKKRKNENY